MSFASNSLAKNTRSGHLSLEIHLILEEQLLKSAYTGIKKSASRYAEINKIFGQ